MAKKDKEKRRLQKTEQWRTKKKELGEIWKNGEKVKPFLRLAGCDLPFFELLDSYESLYRRIEDEARKSFDTLVGIHEVDRYQYLKTNWERLGYGGWEQLTFIIDDEFASYGKAMGSKDPANIVGSCTYFKHPDGGFRTVVLVQHPKLKTVYARDTKYGFKLATLFHELGHVLDAEQGLNLCPVEKRFDLVHGEIFANCYALERLAENHLRLIYDIMYEALEEMAGCDDFRGRIGQGVIEQHPRRKIVDWNDYMEKAMQLAEQVAS